MIRGLCVLGLGCGALLLVGCATPVVTRIETSGAPTVPAASFALAQVPGDLPEAQQKAVDLVSAALAARGWSLSDSGDYLLAVTLADRPADSRLMAGDDSGKPGPTIGPAADRSNNKGCARRDHRLSVRITERASGALLYSGSAAEFHCKATPSESLPHLAAAALEGFDGRAGVRQVERAGVR